MLIGAWIYSAFFGHPKTPQTSQMKSKVTVVPFGEIIYHYVEERNASVV